MGRGGNCTGYMEQEAVADMKEVVVKSTLLMRAATSGNETSGADTQNTTVNTCLGDILVSKREANLMKKDMEKKSRTRRSIFDFSALPEFKWELPIPIKIDQAFSDVEKQEIRKALQDWASVTCVTFTELTAADIAETQPSHLVEFKPGGGCISFVGRVANQPQPVLLEASCFSPQQLTITHEVGHVLGLWHTHQQSGRDAHINVLEENIADGEAGSFILLPDLLVVSANVTGYDYASIMHYDSQDLSRDSRRVLETLDKLFQNTIGQRVRVSFLDARTINTAYCSDKCAAVPLPKPCQHGGYQNPDDCPTCICPDGWSGDQCQALAKPQGDTCGGELVATSQMQIVSNPRHNLGPYPAGQQCTWRIKTSTDRKIKFRFVGDFGMYCTPFARTCHDWVEVRFRQTDQLVGPRFCCESRPRDTFTADTDEVLLNFRVYSDISSYSRRQGFSIEYFVDAVRCDPNPCQNGGSCLTEGSALCQCTAGYTGSTCDQPVVVPGPCDEAPCENEGTCMVSGQSYYCVCPTGYRGFRCEVAPNPCDGVRCGRGVCSSPGGVALCVCNPGSTGATCDTDVDECASTPCQNGGTCMNFNNAYLCRCQRPYSGMNCQIGVDRCASSPCLNGGTCRTIGSSYRCSCRTGYTGPTCDSSTIACSSSPCQQGGRCVQSGGPLGYYCICVRGTRGHNCESGVDRCASSPCLNGGTCRTIGSSYRCSCRTGYTGPTCNSRNSCRPNPCTNGGTCIQVRGTARCLCPQGRGGAKCERVTNACYSNPCTGIQRCMPLTDNRYHCVCPTGQNCNPVEGPTPCSSNPCGNRGQCVDRNTEFTCICMRGFTGTTCENTSVCNPNPCKNGGTCQVHGATYQCMCPPGLSGRLCEQGSCGACGETAGSVCDPCMRYHTIMSTCSHTVSYTTHTHFLIIFRRRVTRTRRVYQACPIRIPLWHTASCCDNAKLITDMRGAKKCVVEGWQSFGVCDARCGGCGHSSRRGYTVSYNNQGRALLTARIETRVCNTAVCESCSWSDYLACRCETPCCDGMRRVGNQCVPTGAP